MSASFGENGEMKMMTTTPPLLEAEPTDGLASAVHLLLFVPPRAEPYNLRSKRRARQRTRRAEARTAIRRAAEDGREVRTGRDRDGGGNGGRSRASVPARIWEGDRNGQGDGDTPRCACARCEEGWLGFTEVGDRRRDGATFLGVGIRIVPVIN